MHGVGAGRLISNRYALNERRAHRDTVEMWSATDNTLGREVAVTVFPTDHPQARAVLDAARRSATLTDHRLIRVLDVGTRGDVSWLVEESLSESSSIAHLVARGPLPPEEARRIAGEVAAALDVAAQQGLHHLHITPHSVRCTDGGLVKIAGLATAAAFEGGPRPDAAAAQRIDTVGVVAVLYAAMTTRWPLPQPVPGLDAAPRVGGHVAAPSEITTAVPPDLDALCRATLNQDDGPHTPAEFVERVSPWSSTPVRHVAPRAEAPAAPAQGFRRAPAESEGGSRVAAVGTLARAAASHREHKEAERAARAAAVRARLEERRNDPGFFNIPEALERQRHDPLEPPAPLIASDPQVEGRYAKVVLGIVAAVIVLALAFAIPTIVRAFSSTTPDAPGSSSEAQPPAAASGSAAPSSAASPSASDSKTLEVASVRGFDPEGDGSENNGGAAKAADNDPQTFWQSEGYKQQLDRTKGGVGVAVELAEKSSVHTVDLDLGPRAQAVTVYTANKRSLDGATEVGKLSDVSGKQTITLDPAQENVRYILVYVTQGAQQDDGKYRAIVAEVAAS